MERAAGSAGRGGVRRLELGLVAALALWLFRDALFSGGVYFKRDIHLVWHPQVEGFVRAVASGAWPVWDASLAFGQALLADPSAQVLYPLTWLNLLMRPWVYYTVYAVAHFVLAAAGMRALASHLGFSRWASLLSAVLFSVSGPYLSMVDLWHHYAGASLMPWVVLACDRALGGGRRDVARFALVLALQILAGSADLVAMTLLLAAALGARRHLRPTWPPSAEVRAVLGRGAFGGLLALGLSAGLWWPALEIVSRAARAELPAAVRTYWSTHPLVALEMVLPGLFSTLPLEKTLRTAFFEAREPFLSSLYVGVVSLGLVGAAVAASRHPLRFVLLGALVAATLVAMGPHTPVYGALTTLLPPLQILRYPVKVMAVAAFAWSLLAGLGADAWRDSGSRRRLSLGTAVPVALVLTLALGGALVVRFFPERIASALLDPAMKIAPEVILPSVLGRLLVPAALAAAVLGLVWAHGRGRLSGRAGAVAMGVLAALDLLAYHRSPNPVAPVTLYTHRPEIVSALGDPDASRVYVYDYSIPGKIERYLEGRAPYALARMPEGWRLDATGALAMQMYLTPETAGRFGLSQAYNIDYRGLYSAPLARLTRLLREAEETPLHLRLLQMGGVTHVVSLHALADLTRERTIEGLFERPILLQRVPQPLPRTYVVGASSSAEGEAGVSRLLDPGFDPRHEVVLSGGPELTEAPGFRGASRILESRADRVVLEAETSARGIVVLLDGFDPGWRARVDGQEVPLLRANLAFRAVAVPSGTHRIELVYRPRGLLGGLALCAVGLALCFALLATGRRAVGP